MCPWLGVAQRSRDEDTSLRTPLASDTPTNGEDGQGCLRDAIPSPAPLPPARCQTPPRSTAHPELGDETLEARILGFAFLEAFGFISLESTVLVTPAVEGLRADGQALADLGAVQALGQVGLGLAQFRDNLFCRGVASCFFSCPRRASETLLASWTTFWGADQKTLAGCLALRV